MSENLLPRCVNCGEVGHDWCDAGVKFKPLPVTSKEKVLRDLVAWGDKCRALLREKEADRD
jgi:hypothetical protein